MLPATRLSRVRAAARGERRAILLARLLLPLRTVSWIRFVATFSLTLALSLVSPRARALGNVEGEIALTGGVAETNRGNAFGPCLGLRAGVAAYGVYVGVIVVSYAGRAQDVSEFSATQAGLEVGFGFRLLDGLLTLRPKIGGGGILIGGSTPLVATPADPYATGPALSVYVEPGVALLVRLGPRAFVGADVNAFIVRNGATQIYPTYAEVTPIGVTEHAQFGLRF